MTRTVLFLGDWICRQPYVNVANRILAIIEETRIRHIVLYTSLRKPITLDYQADEYWKSFIPVANERVQLAFQSLPLMPKELKTIAQSYYALPLTLHVNPSAAETPQDFVVFLHHPVSFDPEHVCHGKDEHWRLLHLETKMHVLFAVDLQFVPRRIRPGIHAVLFPFTCPLYGHLRSTFKTNQVKPEPEQEFTRGQLIMLHRNGLAYPY